MKKIISALLIFSFLLSHIPNINVYAEEKEINYLSEEDKKVQNIIDNLVLEIEKAPKTNSVANMEDINETENLINEVESIFESSKNPIFDKTSSAVLRSERMYSTEDFEGKGTEIEPYILVTSEDLIGLSNLSQTNSFSNIYFSLKNDIINNENWQSIGNDEYPFCGIILGNKKTISLKNTTAENNFGFISHTDGAKLYQLNIFADFIVDDFSGILIGFAKNTEIEECIVDGSLRIKGSFIGGLAGSILESSINNCGSNVEIEVRASGNNYNTIGGIAGSAFKTPINNSFFDGRILNETATFVGGIVGMFSFANVTNCISKGIIDGKENVGGISGSNYNGDIYDSYNLATVSGIDYVGGITGLSLSNGVDSHRIGRSANIGFIKGKNSIGGIAGMHMNILEGNKALLAEIRECANTGTVLGDYKVGGIVGNATHQVVLRHTYNTGEISTCSEHIDKDDIKGGLVGQLREENTEAIGMILNSYNSGVISATSKLGGTTVGGLVGYVPTNLFPSILNNFNNVYYEDNMPVAFGHGPFPIGVESVGYEQLSNMDSTVNDPFMIDTEGVNLGYPILSVLDYSNFLPQISKEDLFYYPGHGTDIDESFKFYYSDEYFYKSSETYNPSLSTMSLSLAMSAFNTADTVYSIDYPEKVDYTNESKNVKDLMKKINMKNIHVNEQYTKKPETDTVGVALGHKKITASGKDYELIAIAVRGGGYEAEWAGNFRLDEVGAHKGFTNAKDEVLRELKNYINNSDNKISGDIKIWITGYSRAAATSNLVAGELMSGFDLGDSVSLKPSDLFAYCFERPMGELKSNINQKINEGADFSGIHNIVNLNDVVTKVAPSYFDFDPYGEDYELPTLVLTANYGKRKDTMLEYYYDFKYLSPYVIDNTVLTSSPLYELLDDFVFKFSSEALETRANFVSSYQGSIINAVKLIYNIELKADDNYQYVLDDFLQRVMGKIKVNYDEIILELVEEDVSLTLVKVISYSFDELGLAPDTPIYFFVKAVADILHLLGKVFLKMPLGIIQVAANSGKVAQGHVPELCMAWMCSQDPNFNKNIAPNTFSNSDNFFVSMPTYRKVSIIGDVSYNVYNEDVLVAKFENDEPIPVIDSYISNYIDEETGAKSVLLPAEASYSIELEPLSDGVIDLYLEEYSVNANSVTRNLSFEKIDLSSTDKVILELPQFINLEENVKNISGSDTIYNFKVNNSTLNPTRETRGEDAKREYYQIIAISDNSEEGKTTIESTGLKIKGRNTIVTATPGEGYIFNGWYENDIKISNEIEYHFKVERDITLFAKFIEEGEEDGVIKIYNVEDFINIRDNLEADYILMSDINFENIEYSPIGNEEFPFSGDFNGNGHTITGLTISLISDNVSLFGVIENAGIRDLTLSNFLITGNMKVGALAGTSISSKINGVTVDENSHIKGVSRIGSLVGQADKNTIVTHLSNKGDVTGTVEDIGGLIGFFEGNMKYSYSTGNIKTTSESLRHYVGGLVGRQTFDSVIEESFTDGVVFAKGSAGGLVGHSTGTIVNSYSQSDVSGQYSGGICSFAIVSTNGVGKHKIENTYFAGTISNTMGLAYYYVDQLIFSSYVDNDLAKYPYNSKDTSFNKTTEEMMQKDTYVDWNFESIWSIIEGNSYPVLRAFDNI